MPVNPMLLNIPEKITTPRLILRPPRPGDGPMMNEAIRESWKELTAWMPWAQGEPPTVEDSEEKVREGAARWTLREDLWIFITDRETGRYLGGTGLHRINWDVPRMEIGYWLRTSETGKGIVTESTNALTRFAFEFFKCKRVEIRCHQRNEKSAAIIRRLGFIHEATLKNNEEEFIGGGDTFVFARFDTMGLPELDVSW